jgi:hypothetical protein
VKYLIMLYGNPTTRAYWDALSDSEKAEAARPHYALSDELASTGELITAHQLADPSLGKRVAVRQGKAMVTDGPLAEVKELLAGFYLVECESMERAVEVASRVPEADFGLVEVRPVLEPGGLEM